MKYQIIYCDVPWRFRNWSMSERAKRGEKWARRNGRSPYDVMATDDIAALPVMDIADKDCALFFWATAPKMNEAFDVLRSWGFTFKTIVFTWAKLTPRAYDNFRTMTAQGKSPEEILGKIFHFGLGYYSHGCAEFCLLATRGHPKRVSKRVSSLVAAPLRQHSRKPDEVRERIVELMGDLPRVELFATERVSGWTSLGLDLDGEDIRDALPALAAAS